MTYKEETYSNIQHLNNGDIILLVTATDIETEVTHEYLKPQIGQKNILKIHEGNNTYYFASLGNYKVIHVQCSMGSSSRSSSLATIKEALGDTGSGLKYSVIEHSLYPTGMTASKWDALNYPMKCYPGQVNRIVNTHTKLQNANRYPVELKCTCTYEKLFSTPYEIPVPDVSGPVRQLRSHITLQLS